MKDKLVKKDSLTILVIDDNQTHRSFAVQAFEGHERYTAANARAGMDQFEECSPDITLIDIGLPDGNGLELLEKIIQYDPEAYAVMLTASRIASDVEKARQIGAAGYVLKPFSRQKLLDCIQVYRQYQEKLAALTSEERKQNYQQKVKGETLDLHLQETGELSETMENPFKHRHRNASEMVDETLNSWRILFVDDYLTNRERAQLQLQKLGCTVDIAGSADELKALCRKHRYHLIFLDTELPDTSGYEVCKELRRSNQEPSLLIDEHCVIVGMIEAAYEIEQQLWQRAGMNNFIRKPARFKTLQDMIRKYVEFSLEQKVS